MNKASKPLSSEAAKPVQLRMFIPCMCATGFGQQGLRPGYICTPERVRRYHARFSKASELRGFAATELRS